jgi:hypothetical protein
MPRGQLKPLIIRGAFFLNLNRGSLSLTHNSPHTSRRLVRADLNSLSIDSAAMPAPMWPNTPDMLSSTAKLVSSGITWGGKKKKETHPLDGPPRLQLAWLDAPAAPHPSSSSVKEICRCGIAHEGRRKAPSDEPPLPACEAGASSTASRWRRTLTAW